MRDRFAELHPLVNFIFFLAAAAFTMISMHPACLLITFISALSYTCLAAGDGRQGRLVLLLMSMFLMALVINPAFNHRGVTVLAYLPTGNVLTLESILYGAAAGVMLVSAVLWFYCFGRAMTTDKLAYLFGRISPTLSLLFTMTLRFAPRFAEHFRMIREARKGLGGSVPENAGARRGIVVSVRELAADLSAMITWAVDSVSDTADSMRSRGFGSGRRTAFSLYRLTPGDRAALVWMLVTGALTAAGMAGGSMYFRYYPAISCAEQNAGSGVFFLAYLLFCLTPVSVNIRDLLRWKRVLKNHRSVIE